MMEANEEGPVHIYVTPHPEATLAQLRMDYGARPEPQAEGRVLRFRMGSGELAEIVKPSWPHPEKALRGRRNLVFHGDSARFLEVCQYLVAQGYATWGDTSWSLSPRVRW